MHAAIGRETAALLALDKTAALYLSCKVETENFLKICKATIFATKQDWCIHVYLLFFYGHSFEKKMDLPRRETKKHLKHAGTQDAYHQKRDWCEQWWTM